MNPDSMIRGINELTTAVADRDAFIDYETDMPASLPTVAIAVARAGITAQPVRLTVPSLLDDGAEMSIIGKADLFSALPANRRGVHMSRMVRACHDLNGRDWPSLADYLRALTAAVADLQQLDTATVRLRAETTVVRAAPVTGGPSPDTFQIEATGVRTTEGVQVRVGLGATVMTACPCTQAYTRYETIAALLEPLGDTEANTFGFAYPTFTHSQRGVVWVHAEGADGLGLCHLFEAIDEGAHLTYELLKRPDEHALVRAAHNNPQFTEDVVRDIAAHLVQKYSHLLPPATTVTVRCRNYESIHGHDAVSEISATVAELLEMTQSS